MESLKSDGIKIDKKYDNLYKIQDSEMPTDIQVMINNNEIVSLNNSQNYRGYWSR